MKNYCTAAFQNVKTIPWLASGERVCMCAKELQRTENLHGNGNPGNEKIVRWKIMVFL